jgi:hypothetical protein
MNNYKLTQSPKTVIRLFDNAFIPFDPANTDHANFKQQILAGEAELQDADGVLMSAEQAKDYVKGLP